MVTKEGAGAAGIIVGVDFLNKVINEGGFITPEFLETLAGLDLTTLAMAGVLIYIFRKRKAQPLPANCPYRDGVIDLTDEVQD